MRKRVRGILIEDGKITLIKRTRDGETFYVFPGGGIEDGETDEQALAREIKEELGLDISVEKLVAKQIFGKPKSKECMNFFYICKKKGGKLGTGCGPEYTPGNGYEGIHEPIQLSIGEIGQLDLRPKDVRNLIFKKYGKMKLNKFLGETVKIKIDRPIGSKHPKHNFVYEVNYGFVPDTKAPDGEEIDAYLLGVNDPVNEFTGKCIAIIHRSDDNDDKLVVVPEKFREISDEEILKAVNFQEKWFNSVVVR